METLRKLVLRSNRHLGTALLKLNLIDEEQLHLANKKLMANLQGDNIKEASLLTLLLYDVQALDENRLLAASKFPLIDLVNFNIPPNLLKDTNIENYWATRTIPFDKQDGFQFIATAYNLSKPVIDYWENIFDDSIIWYTTSLKSISIIFQNLDSGENKDK